jgi:hypothetical protein
MPPAMMGITPFAEFVIASIVAARQHVTPTCPDKFSGSASLSCLLVDKK